MINNSNNIRKRLGMRYVALYSTSSNTTVEESVLMCFKYLKEINFGVDYFLWMQILPYLAWIYFRGW